MEAMQHPKENFKVVKRAVIGLRFSVTKLAFWLVGHRLQRGGGLLQELWGQMAHIIFPSPLQIMLSVP